MADCREYLLAEVTVNIPSMADACVLVKDDTVTFTDLIYFKSR
jgi:hypothetical protein